MVYIRRSDGAYATFEGMTAAQIAEMLVAQNLTCEFIDEAAYQAATRR